ncbi:copper chaperone of lysine biosynthesis protein [Serendipita sp. 399]|nr:copper chaperone of lysine biosynthesis protein [Serendipita sp. 399]
MSLAKSLRSGCVVVPNCDSDPTINMDKVQLFLIYLEFSTVDHQYDLALSLVKPTCQARAKRFHQKEDAWRYLLGKILQHVVVCQTLGSACNPQPLEFKETPTGKPYLVGNPSTNLAYFNDLQHFPVTTPALGFNLSHDHSVILLGTRRYSTASIANEIGVDVTKAKLPTGDTFSTLLESVSIAFTAEELNQLALVQATEQAAIDALFQMWTLKEAYVKALGVGIGFELSRISFDAEASVLNVDGEVLDRWACYSFKLCSPKEEENCNGYLGAVCYRLGEEELGSLGIVTWLTDTEVQRHISIVEASVLLDQMHSLVYSVAEQ